MKAMTKGYAVNAFESPPCDTAGSILHGCNLPFRFPYAVNWPSLAKRFLLGREFGSSQWPVAGQSVGIAEGQDNKAS